MWERVALAVMVVGTVAGAVALGWASDWRYGVGGEDTAEPAAVTRPTPAPHFSGPEAAGHVEAWLRSEYPQTATTTFFCADGDYHDGRWTVRCTIEGRGDDLRLRFYLDDRSGAVALAD